MNPREEEKGRHYKLVLLIFQILVIEFVEEFCLLESLAQPKSINQIATCIHRSLLRAGRQIVFCFGEIAREVPKERILLDLDQL